MSQERLRSKELESGRGGSRIDWESVATGFQECLLDSGLVSPRVKTDREVKSLTVWVSLRGRCCSRGLNRDFCALRYAQRHRKVDFFSLLKTNTLMPARIQPPACLTLSVSALERRWKPSSNLAASGISQRENMSLRQAETRMGAHGLEGTAQTAQRAGRAQVAPGRDADGYSGLKRCRCSAKR